MNTVKHALRHGYQHEYRLRHDHRHINPYGVLATQLADASLEEVIVQLDEAAQQVNLSGLLFPGGVNFRVSSADQEEVENIPDTSNVPLEALQLRDIDAILRQALVDGRLSVPEDKALEYVEYLFNPIKEFDQKTPDPVENTAEKQEFAWGQLMISPLELAQMDK